MTSTDELARASVLAFGPLRIAYDDRVLVPRPWTQLQARWAAELAASVPPGRMLELCSGAGQIGLLAALLADRNLVAVDLNEAACRFTAHNARAAGIGDRVEVRHGSLESACGAEEVFPIIIADPPWVPAARTGAFPQDPLSAIDGGPDGLDVARACLEVVEAHLAGSGAALLQLGSTDQVDRLRQDLGETLLIDDVRSGGGRGVVAKVVRRFPGT